MSWTTVSTLLQMNNTAHLLSLLQAMTEIGRHCANPAAFIISVCKQRQTKNMRLLFPCQVFFETDLLLQ